ncbi:pilus assembly protein TadG-related protein [Tautonia sociabilis]|uniref:Putative Flp pilus-assembly TadG-like N-terminal domain-containing protein n=1 Tax=Tautonia sociabilis TaxID=2080755 RepID=A0A432MMD7_9BACT|nr:pilus assembly protein TadG-related protein [Tautonia sociabilis]RUL88238.1 hypothetical protein TsocGM_07825 [Tautonia sociabilis]
MTIRSRSRRRRGTIAPVVAMFLVSLCGFVALAVDIGLLAAARSDCQNAADSAALAGARALDGSSPQDLGLATSKARQAAGRNQILNRAPSPEAVEVEHGSYHYDRLTERFSPRYPPVPPDTYNLTRVTVRHRLDTAFARTLGFNHIDLVATATAAHRPRDVTIILDFSGSMNNESDLWNNEGYLGSANNSPNNRDPIFPRFGHYSDVNGARLQTTSTDPRVGKCNITQEALGLPPLVEGFHQHSRGEEALPAFSPEPDEYDRSPGGDLPLLTNGHTGSSYAHTLAEVVGNGRDSDFEDYGYDFYYLYRSYRAEGRGSSSARTAARNDLENHVADPIVQDRLFKGYTLGPKYWGKTFFIWPPSPVGRHPSLPNPDSSGRRVADWRNRFFLHDGGSYPHFGGPMDDNTQLFDSSGALRDPSGRYVINYRAILSWIKSGPNPFPPRLRAGRLLYYSAIPDDVPASAYDHSRRNDLIADQDQRFWKEYIDYVIGVWRSPNGSIVRPGQPACSYGPDFNWGSRDIDGKPSTRYMDYDDNPQRPRHRFWFGPMTMVQFISDTGLLPGTARDISMYPAKLGISGALQDIKNNHPNDLVSIILFSRPRFQGERTGAFNQAQFNLGRDYDGMIDGLWFPPHSGEQDVRPWDPDGEQTPRAFGDYTSNTATQHGFMLAYNQLSSSQTVRLAGAGGLGRKGAQRLVVLETDGMANVNTRPDGGFHDAGANRSYYRILPGDTIRAGGYNEGDLLAVVRRIAAREDDPSTGPGYSTPRKPVVIHTIAFGPLFEPTASGQASAVDLLQKISAIGGTRFPSSSSDPRDGYKWCIGTLDERKDRLRQAFSRVMDDGVSVSLIE